MFPDVDEVTHLGTGGFASTFKVVSGDEVFAVKVIDPDVAEVERVARELDALRRVHHPNVVGYLDHGEKAHDGKTYAWLKMAYVDGRTLWEILAEGGPIDLRTKLSLLSQAVAGASAIWAAGTAHRDLTPNNLMVTAGGQLVIVDLGMARHVDDVTMTVLPTPGTPGWMAPEQVGTAPSHGDWRSDQFVLGLVAFALLTGSAPFASPNVMERWVAPANQTVPPVRSIDPDLSEPLSDMVERMLARQPHRRYARADALVAAVAEAAALPPEPPRPPAAFFLAVGNYRSFCPDDFLVRLGADGVVVQIRAHDSTAAVAECVAATPADLVVDPMTHYARSPIEFQLGAYRERPYGGVHHAAAFASSDERSAWCSHLLDTQLEYSPTTLMAPYFFAGDGEFDWITETLACAAEMRDLVAAKVEAGELPALLPIWTTVAVTSTWLSNETSRDRLLAAVTGEELDTLHLLVSTHQMPFAPLRDTTVFEAFADVFTVMGDAGVPVVVGQRASSGLLLLALGASGWTHGQESRLQNMGEPPQSEERGGRPADRIYLPELLNSVNSVALAQFTERRGGRWPVATYAGRALMVQNPTLEQLSTAQRYLLLQHNVEAQRAQAAVLALLSAEGRRNQMSRWISEAASLWAELPTPANAADTGNFLDSWAAALR